jgi:7,8-dihydroneopterin aldolase/epimerase/oxygenase
LSRAHLDQITLAGIRLNVRIGVTATERSVPQPCDADVVICGDFEPAAAADDIATAVDYTQALSAVIRTAESGEFNLLEALAYALARAVSSTSPAVRVRVRVRKRPAPLSDRLDYVEAETGE